MLKKNNCKLQLYWFVIIIKFYLFSSMTLFVISAVPASARTAEEAFYDVVNKEISANRQPAKKCDVQECRNWWWRNDGRFSLLAVEHVKVSGADRILAVCWRDIASAGDMQCISTAGRKFSVSSSDAEMWRVSYMSANANFPQRSQPYATPAAPVVTLDLNCAAPVVTKGDPNPGRNPVVAAHVRIEQGDWFVTFKFADGSTVERADQYNGGSLSPTQIAKNNASAKQPVIAQWAGGHKRRADVVMIGSLYQDGPASYRYVEVVASTRHTEDAKVIVAQCQPIRAADPTPSASPPPSYPSDPGEPAMTFTVEKNDDCDNCVTVSAVGKIVSGSDTTFVEMVKAQMAQGKRANILRLASPGGSVQPALSIGRSTRQWGMKTVVESGCVSACALAFMGGVTRHAAPMTLGVHQVSFSNGPQLSGVATAMVSQVSISEILNYAKEMGIDSEVIGIAAATPPHEMHYFGATELSALNLNTK